MIENKFETVSSVVDSYQPSDEVIDELLNDADLSATWDRYHLMGDLMRDETSDVINVDFASTIALAIENEPTVLAPRSSSSHLVKSKIKAKVIQLAKPFGQMAIAASAAGLMVMGVQQNSVDNGFEIPENKMVQTTPFGGVAEPVSLNFQQTSRSSEKQAFIEQQRRFQALLSDHQQQVKFSSVDVNAQPSQKKAEESAK